MLQLLCVEGAGCRIRKRQRESEATSVADEEIPVAGAQDQSTLFAEAPAVVISPMSNEKVYTNKMSPEATEKQVLDNAKNSSSHIVTCAYLSHWIYIWPWRCDSFRQSSATQLSQPSRWDGNQLREG
jgi:hypothetical protein